MALSRRGSDGRRQQGTNGTPRARMDPREPPGAGKSHDGPREFRAPLRWRKPRSLAPEVYWRLRNGSPGILEKPCAIASSASDISAHVAEQARIVDRGGKCVQWDPTERASKRRTKLVNPRDRCPVASIAAGKVPAAVIMPAANTAAANVARGQQFAAHASRPSFFPFTAAVPAWGPPKDELW